MKVKSVYTIILSGGKRVSVRARDSREALRKVGGQSIKNIKRGR